MSSRERGSVLAELAIVLPVLLLLFAGVVDGGRWSNAYFATSRMAYEAARFGATLLEPVREGAPDSSGYYRVVDPRLDARITELRERYNLPHQTPVDAWVRFGSEPMVKVRIEHSFTPLILDRFGITIPARMAAVGQAPYLYREN
jgi:TadE-like protein